MQASDTSAGTTLDWDAVEANATEGRIDLVLEMLTSTRDSNQSVPLDDPILGMPVVTDGVALWDTHLHWVTEFVDQFYPSELDLVDDQQASTFTTATIMDSHHTHHHHRQLSAIAS